MEQETGTISDGYHTFDELYEHRYALYIALCKSMQGFEYHGDIRNHGDKFNHKKVWKSIRHSDGELCFGGREWFIMGIGSEKGKQITYHLPMKYWALTDFAEQLEKAHEWDGHTSNEVIARLYHL